MCGVGVLQSWHDASMQLTATAGANVAQHAARAIPQGQQQALPYLKPHSVALHVTGLAPLPFRAKLTLQYCSAAGKQEEREGKEGRRAWLSELADQHQRTCQPRPAGPGQARPARKVDLAGYDWSQDTAACQPSRSAKLPLSCGSDQAGRRLSDASAYQTKQKMAPPQRRRCCRPCRSCQVRSSPQGPCPEAGRGRMAFVGQARRGWAAEDAALHIGSAVPTCRPSRPMQNRAAHTTPSSPPGRRCRP